MSQIYSATFYWRDENREKNMALVAVNANTIMQAASRAMEVLRGRGVEAEPHHMVVQIGGEEGLQELMREYLETRQLTRGNILNFSKKVPGKK